MNSATGTKTKILKFNCIHFLEYEYELNFTSNDMHFIPFIATCKNEKNNM